MCLSHKHTYTPHTDLQLFYMFYIYTHWTLQSDAGTASQK